MSEVGPENELFAQSVENPAVPRGRLPGLDRIGQLAEVACCGDPGVRKGRVATRVPAPARSDKAPGTAREPMAFGLQAVALTPRSRP